MPCHTLTVAAGNMSTCAHECVDETDVFMRSRRHGRADSADGTAAGTISLTKEAARKRPLRLVPTQMATRAAGQAPMP